MHPLRLAALIAALSHATQDPPLPCQDHPCDRELLDDEEAFERNAWAAGCGYVSDIQATWAFIHDLWFAFERPGAPMNGNDPCAQDWGEPVAACAAMVD